MKNKTYSKNERRYTIMNKIIGAIGIAMLLVFAIGFVAAAEVSAEVTDDSLSGSVSVAPDSSFYGLKLGWEKAMLAFTFNQEKKAQKELELANERLIEARIMAEKGNALGFEKAQAAHDALIERAKARIESIEADSKESKIKDSISKVSGLQIAIEAHENRVSALKERLAEENLTDDAREKIEDAITKMEEKNDAFKEKLDGRKEAIKTKLMAVTDMTEAEAEAAVAKIDNETGLGAAKMAIAERKIERANEAIVRMEEKIASAKVKGVDVSAAEEKLIEIKANIATAQASFTSGKYLAALDEIKEFSNYGRQNSEIVKIISKEKKEMIKEKLDEAKDRMRERLGKNAGDLTDSEDETESSESPDSDKDEVEDEDETESSESQSSEGASTNQS